MQAASDIFWKEFKIRWPEYSVIGDNLKTWKDPSTWIPWTKPDWKHISRCAVYVCLEHARTGDATCISGYIGKGDAFCDAITAFAMTYAEQTERDYQALKEAVSLVSLKPKKAL